MTLANIGRFKANMWQLSNECDLLETFGAVSQMRKR